MARKKKGNDAIATDAPSGPKRFNISVEEAENGFTINCSGSGKNGEYHSKSYVAPDHQAAIRIATAGLSHLGSKAKGKKKKGKGKIALAKRG